MGFLTYTYTFTGSEAHGTAFLTVPIQNWTGVWTIDGTLDGPAGTIVNTDFTLRHAGGGTVCYAWGLSWATTDITKSFSTTVGGAFGTWNCTDWDTFTCGYSGATFDLAAGRVLTITISGPGIITPGAEAVVGLTQVSILG